MKFKTGALALAASLVLGTTAMAEPIKIGVIGAFSGPYSLYGTDWQQAFEIYMEQHGGKIDGHEIEFVYRDLPTPDPQKAKALAQELIVREQVQYLTGFVFTPDVMAVAPLVEEAKVPTIALTPGSSAIIPSSKYMLRTSFTTYQAATTVANFAADEGEKTVVTMVTDYVPGVEEETAFKQTFETRGGKVLETIRMPLSTTDFAPFLQKAKAAKPDAIFTFLPGGPATYAFVKTYIDIGMRDSGIRFLGTGETQEFDLQNLGEAAIGMETGFIYSAAHDNEPNRKLAGDLAKKFPNAILALPHPEAYDAMTMFSAMIKATGGERDADKAMAAVDGMEWESPRGPVRVEAGTRDFIQNVYMRKVDRDAATGLLINNEFKTYEMVPDSGRKK